MPFHHAVSLSSVLASLHASSVACHFESDWHESLTTSGVEILTLLSVGMDTRFVVIGAIEKVKGPGVAGTD